MPRFQHDVALAVHGGAGPADDDEDRNRARREGVEDSLRAGMAVLDGGGSSLEAVAAAVVVLEDHPVFNAGRGSALTTAGTVEMDASVADGATRRAGAVAAVTGIRNPVLAARAVLDDGRHVILAGAAATEYARAAGLRLEAPEWFVTERRRRQLDADRMAADTPAEGGTVGAVALDGASHLAAATSTGGRRGQIPGRIGDSPVIGAGTWADDRTCAVSGTGIGEAFLRAVFAHEVDARMRFLGEDVEAAAGAALAVVTAVGGTGGCVALDRSGRLATPFTTAAFTRGWAGLGGLHIEVEGAGISGR
jgi:isoaspartyl peptidase/L-asparaginase-like protein (Ntn-hydrolase superfamily)